MTTTQNNNEASNAAEAFTDYQALDDKAEQAAKEREAFNKAENERIEAALRERGIYPPSERVTSIPPSQIEMLKTAAIRLRQSGKTSLAKGLEQIVSDYGQGEPLRIIVPALHPPSESAQSVHPTKVAEAPESALPPYVAQNGEVEQLKALIHARLNALLTGPTGCGKTHLAQYVTNELGWNFISVQGGAGATFERIIAKDTLEVKEGATITVRPSAETPQTWSVLPKAMSTPKTVLYLDEPNAIPNEVLFYLFSAMDHRRTITFDDGTSLTAHPDFVVVGAMNEGTGYSGTNLLNHAFRERAEVIDMRYLPEEREAKLLVSRTGVAKETAGKLAQVARNLRDSLTNKTIRTPIGTRSLLACAKLIALGMTIKSATEVAIINKVPANFPNERKAVSDILAAYFGSEVD